METSDLVLWGGIGILAYYLFFNNTSASTGTAAPATTTTPPAASSAGAAAPTEAQITLAQLQAMGNSPVLVAAQQSGSLPANGTLTASQWNWYLTQVSGIPGPSLATYLATTAPVSIATWWQAVMLWANQQAINSQASALTATAGSGVAGLAGLGSGRTPGKQPGQGVNSNFPAPGNNVDGRFDFNELGWN